MKKIFSFLIIAMLLSSCNMLYITHSSIDTKCDFINGINWSSDSKKIIFACSLHHMPGMGPTDSYFTEFDLNSNRSINISNYPNSTFTSPIIIDDQIIAQYCGNAASNSDYCGIWQMYPSKKFLMHGNEVSTNPLNKNIVVGISHDNKLDFIQYNTKTNTSSNIYSAIFPSMAYTEGMDWKKDIIAISLNFNSSNKELNGIYYINLANQNMKRIATGLFIHMHPSISPDNKYISYCGGKTITLFLNIYDLDNNRNLEFNDKQCTYSSWSPDGQNIAIADVPHNFDIVNVNKLLLE